MSIPSVKMIKSTTGGAPALNTNVGILAIIASASTVPSLPVMITNQGMAASTFGSGMLPECATYAISVSGNPVVGYAVTPTVTGSYGTITTNVTGTSVVTNGSTHPFLHYHVIVTIVNGGTVGTAGITYTYSMDGGISTSTVQALGTATVLTIAFTGVSFSLGAGTLIAGDNWSVFTERPQLNNTDLSAALTVFGQTSLPWEGVYVDAQYNTGTVGLLDTWLAAREAKGQFNFAIIGTRFLNEPAPTAETPSAYQTAMTTLTSGDASNRVAVCVDGGRLGSLLTGYTTKFPTGLFLGAEAMALSPNIGIDPAYVGNGPIPGVSITSGGSPLDYDEFVYGPSLDPQRLTTLRSFASGGPTGVYITNANVLISAGSPIYWLQILRVLNAACTAAWKALQPLLSIAVDTVQNKTTGAQNIKPTSRLTLQGIVNPSVKAAVKGQCTDAGFSVNADDDLSQPYAPLNCNVAVQMKVYVKNYVVTVAATKTISPANGG